MVVEVGVGMAGTVIFPVAMPEDRVKDEDEERVEDEEMRKEVVATEGSKLRSQRYPQAQTHGAKPISK